MEHCVLLGDFGWIVQGLLGVISFSSLLSNFHTVKRRLEKVRRTWTIWFMDASKQAFSAGMLHMLNLALSHEISVYMQDPDECI